MFELKELRREDFPAVKELFRRAFSGPPWNDDWSDDVRLEEYLKDITQVRGAVGLGLFEEGSLVGISIGELRHWCGGTEYKIEEFCIIPERQGSGLGGKFMELIEGYLKQRGVEQIFLMTQRTMPACGFYKHLGFREINGLVSLMKEL
ncbi:MAG: GNAT family N-acetyltransferase [Ruminococcus sp.]|nr:GNAT family N-acetyltransferase [Ruminococcus sp.]